MDSDAARHFEDPCHTTRCLYSVASSVVLFTTLFWICDVNKLYRLGGLLETCGREYGVDISVTRFLQLGVCKPSF
jgi:hypothetical protein